MNQQEKNLAVQLKQEEIDNLNSIVEHKKNIKESFLSAKGSGFIGISLRNSEFSITFNTEVEGNIYDGVIGNFIDSIVPVIESEIETISIKNAPAIVDLENQLQVLKDTVVLTEKEQLEKNIADAQARLMELNN